MEVIVLALENIAINPLRAFLTTAGIIIGIAAVIVVVAIGEGNREVIQAKIREMGANLLEIRNYNSGAGNENGAVRTQFIDEKDISDIISRLPSIEAIAPVIGIQRSVCYESKAVQVDCLGTYPDYQRVMNLKLKKGRFLTPFDEREERRVCVLNETAVGRLLVGRSSLVDKYIQIEGVRYRIVGVARDKDAIYNGIRPMVYLPFSTLRREVPFISIQNAYFTARETGNVEALARQVRMLLYQRYGAVSQDWVYSMSEILESEKRMSTQTTLVILGVACISLLVGGIGIMNMMLVTVRERTSEIGIRKALGATSAAILAQFIAEGTILCVIGGLMGVLAGIIIANTAATMLQMPVRISWIAAAVGLIFSSAVGMLSSLYPAYKAAGLLPVEALRYE